MEYESEAIDRAIYGGQLNVDDFQTTEHRIQLILALLDQWGVASVNQKEVEILLYEVLAYRD